MHWFDRKIASMQLACGGQTLVVRAHRRVWKVLTSKSARNLDEVMEGKFVPDV